MNDIPWVFNYFHGQEKQGKQEGSEEELVALIERRGLTPPNKAK